ncbi:transporter, partial [Staphylococcus cohnii]
HNTVVIRHFLGKVQIIVPLNYNIKLYFSALYGNAYVNETSYKVENNNIKVVEETKEDNYAVNVYLSTFIGDVEVIYK